MNNNNNTNKSTLVRLVCSEYDKYYLNQSRNVPDIRTLVSGDKSIWSFRSKASDKVWSMVLVV